MGQGHLLNQYSTVHAREKSAWGDRWVTEVGLSPRAGARAHHLRRTALGQGVGVLG